MVECDDLVSDAGTYAETAPSLVALPGGRAQAGTRRRAVRCRVDAVRAEQAGVIGARRRVACHGCQALSSWCLAKSRCDWPLCECPHERCHTRDVPPQSMAALGQPARPVTVLRRSLR